MRKKCKGTELSVFKGREAKLNRAIFQTLAHKGAQTTYDVHKQVSQHRGFKRIRYSSVNKRIRNLEESGYLTKVATKETKAGFEASLYGLRVAAYLALLLNSLDLDLLLSQVSEDAGLTILGELLSTAEPGNAARISNF